MSKLQMSKLHLVMFLGPWSEVTKHTLALFRGSEAGFKCGVSVRESSG